jgi:hypothetical protein
VSWKALKTKNYKAKKAFLFAFEVQDTGQEDAVKNIWPKE